MLPVQHPELPPLPWETSVPENDPHNPPLIVAVTISGAVSLQQPTLTPQQLLGLAVGPDMFHLDGQFLNRMRFAIFVPL
jgi:hypothetical protein